MFGIIDMVIKVRSILHCDLNSFFASVECIKKPELKKVPMAVCGDPKMRHGIILAKNDIAKAYGIYTPETVYSALKKCPKLVLVKSHHEEYEKYSKLVNKIYLKYTDRVEPFSIDESFLDVTESIALFGNPYEIAFKIKEEVKHTLGLTISVGVSFNKSLAKLGSDLKKPDAITVISYENFRNIIYPLPVNSLIFCGKASNSILNKMRIYTIGDLANYDKEKIVKKLGKSGILLYNYANGIDNEEVARYDKKYMQKSFSKGITFSKDLNDEIKLKRQITYLTYDISKSLRENNFKCSIVSISLKDKDFHVINRQKRIKYTDLFKDILYAIFELFDNNYIKGTLIRAITVAISGFDSEYEYRQISFLDLQNEDNFCNEKLEKVSKIVDSMYDKYMGKVVFGSLINNINK